MSLSIVVGIKIMVLTPYVVLFNGTIRSVSVLVQWSFAMGLQKSYCFSVLGLRKLFARLLAMRLTI